MHMFVQAIKGVEVGLGCDVANKFVSEVHDEIFMNTRRMLQTADLKGSRIMWGNRRRSKQRGTGSLRRLI